MNIGSSIPKAVTVGGREAEYHQASFLQRLAPTLAYVGLAAALIVTMSFLGPLRDDKAHADDTSVITSDR